MDNIYIYQHLGLGDHIICNGLVRELIKRQQSAKYFIFCLKRTHASVSFMFRDLNNIQTIPVEGDSAVIEFLRGTTKPTKIIVIGFNHNNNYNCTWDEAFYIQHAVPFAKRWESFFVERDSNREAQLFNRLASSRKYALIHNVGSDNIDRIDYSKVDSSLHQIVVEPITDVVFDYLTLIQYADEIHCVDSSFFHLVESTKTKAKLFYHRDHKRRSSPQHNHCFKSSWNII